MISREFYRFCRQTAELDPIELKMLIHIARPELQGRLKEVMDQSHGATVLMAKDFAIKAPRGDRSIRDVFNEMKVLTALEGSDLSVPRITEVGKNAFYFFMTKIKGRHLHEAAELTTAQAKTLASDIAQFKFNLEKYAKDHPEKCASLRKKKFLTAGIPKRVLEVLKIVDLQEGLPDRARKFLGIMIDYLEAVPKRDLVLVHHDLHSHNITLNRKKRLEGTLDFADTMFSLPEADFDFSLRMTYGMEAEASLAFKHKIAEEYAALASIDAMELKKNAICLDALDHIYKDIHLADLPRVGGPMSERQLESFIWRLESGAELYEEHCTPKARGGFRSDKNRPQKLI